MIEIDAVESRIIGCLIEKEITTPEYYPLTLNALVNACNQRSNRDPLVNFDDDDVTTGLERLRAKQLVSTLTGGGNRVPKYGHRLQERLNLGRREMALLCELLLRGPQTAGELRDRAGRMHRFGDTDEVERCLQTLAARPEQSYVTLLPRQPGLKEPRWALLSGTPQATEGASAASSRPRSDQTDRVTELEGEVASLRQRMEDLEQQWVRFKQQFE
ncbi:MAG TPA: YceH family protein [Bryobacteraceae bacterium]|nr:YceH family protein [Bryobacteraceae bacterium]